MICTHTQAVVLCTLVRLRGTAPTLSPTPSSVDLEGWPAEGGRLSMCDSVGWLQLACSSLSSPVEVVVEWA